MNAAGGCARRAFLAGAAATTTAALSGCSVYGEENSAPAAAPPAATPSGKSGKGGKSGTAGKGGQAGAAALARTADIPVGGGKIFAEQAVVVTQPEAGTFKAFSTVCTHQGCAVNEIKAGTINCPCHGSKFAVADGSVKAGPAPKPLPARQVTVDGDSLRLA